MGAAGVGREDDATHGGGAGGVVSLGEGWGTDLFGVRRDWAGLGGILGDGWVPGVLLNRWRSQ